MNATVRSKNMITHKKVLELIDADDIDIISDTIVNLLEENRILKKENFELYSENNHLASILLLRGKKCSD